MTSIKLYSDGLDAEIVFLLKLQQSLPSNFSVEKTPDKYNPIDYIVKRDGLLFCYIELKTRFLNLAKYPSLMIGKVKLQAISKLDKPTYLLWDDTINNKFYFTLFNADMLTLDSVELNGSAVSFILKTSCRQTYALFVDEILGTIS